MRRADRAVTDPAAIDVIIRGSSCCHLGLADGDTVYIVPISFGFVHQDGQRTFYFHSASEGRKLDLLRSGRPVSFELECGYALAEGRTACAFSAHYRSVMGTGLVRFLTEPTEQQLALRELMRQCTGRADWSFPPEAVQRVCLFALDVTSISAKQNGPW